MAVRLDVPHPVEVVDYDPGWKDSFSRLKAQLVELMGTFPAKIEHVGSTSVPGAAAKPIIDIDVVVRSRLDVKGAIRLLEKGGYRHVGDLGIPGREAFESPGGTVAHHLYVVVEGSPPHISHLRFRDYLRNNPEVRSRYSALKKSLAVRFRDDREAYTDAKTSFVEEALKKAETGEA